MQYCFDSNYHGFKDLHVTKLSQVRETSQLYDLTFRSKSLEDMGISFLSQNLSHASNHYIAYNNYIVKGFRTRYYLRPSNINKV